MTALDPGGPVICAYEDKPIARHALRASAWLADALGTSLVVAHVFDPMGVRVLPTRDMLAASVTTEDLERNARQRAVRQLDAAAERVAGANVETELLENDPVGGVLDLVASRGARLLVTGTAARVGLDRILIGSVTSDLAARSPCPVIAVPRAAALEEPGPVVAGYDGSEHGHRAARCGAELAAQLGRELVLVHVAKRGDELADGPLALGVDLVRESGDPADTLVRVARERAAVLILVGSRGRNALSSALLGSVSAGIVGVADRPVGLVAPSVSVSTG